MVTKITCHVDIGTKHERILQQAVSCPSAKRYGPNGLRKLARDSDSGCRRGQNLGNGPGKLAEARCLRQHSYATDACAVARRNVAWDEGLNLGEPKKLRDAVRDPIGRAVRVGVRRDERTIVPDQVGQQRPLITVLRNACHSPEQERMMGEQDVRAEGNGFVDGIPNGINCEQHPLDGAARVTAHKPNPVPVFCRLFWPQPIDHGMNFGNGRGQQWG